MRESDLALTDGAITTVHHGRTGTAGNELRWYSGFSCELQIPQGAIITLAQLVLSNLDGAYPISDRSVTMRAADNGQDVHTITPADIHSWVGASQSFTLVGSGIGPTTVDITALVQAVVNRPGWVLGNVLNLRYETPITDFSTVSGLPWLHRLTNTGIVVDGVSYFGVV